MASKVDKRKKKLFSNTIFLYLLVFSNYFFSLITVPYQTRVLGPEIYGKLGWAMATMAYFAIVVEFGFLLSATERIARNRDDKREVERIVGAVVASKIALALIGAIAVAVLSFTWGKMNSDPWFYLLCYASAIIPSFLLDFFYRGIEEMQVITIRSVATSAFFTVCIFIFLHDRNNYWVVPALNATGSLIAVGAVFWHMTRKLKYRFVVPEISYCWMIFKESIWFFLSRIATTFYTATNTFLLGFVYPVASAPIGYYTSADKLLTVMKSACSPVADSLYPYMVRNKDFRLLKKLLLIGMPISIAIAAVVWLLSDWICLILFGSEFAGAAPLLRLMLPIFVITLPVYLLGFPTLSPLGGAKAVNRSVIFSAIFHIAALFVLFIGGWLSVRSVIVLTFITEIFILVYRAIAILRLRKILKGAGE